MEKQVKGLQKLLTKNIGKKHKAKKKKEKAKEEGRMKREKTQFQLEIVSFCVKE